jgi:alpha-D-xyloside xylohydrolase
VSETYALLGAGWRESGGRWHALPPDAARIERRGPTTHCIVFERPQAKAVELCLAAPEEALFLGGGERFERLDLRGSVVRHYLENAGQGSGTYLPVPWIASTAGFSMGLAGHDAASFHLATPWEPDVLRIQIESSRIELHLDLGTLAEQHRAWIARVGPPEKPGDAFFGLWKAGDWRTEDALTVAADREGFRAMGLPLDVKLIDAYWEEEIHCFEFDRTKYPEGLDMVRTMAAEGTQVHLWLCPWLVVGTRAHASALDLGHVIVDRQGQPLVRRPGANPNVRAALIDFTNPSARDWWVQGLRSLVQRGIAGFKADFGEQLPDHAVLHNGLSGPGAHNAYVKAYLDATAAAFEGPVRPVLSRSAQAGCRQQIWSGDQTSDFCPKSGLPAAIRAAQSASLSGFPFIGSDIGGYFGTPTPQVFARWAQFSAFQPLFMLHGLGCREPWQMDADSKRIFTACAKLHLELKPYFLALAAEAVAGGLPPVRMMPLAFPEIEWRGLNDWDQQFMLGDALLVAPVAFYASTRAVFLPPGRWYDALSRRWIDGGQTVLHEVPMDAVPVFFREGASIPLQPDRLSSEVWIVHGLDTASANASARATAIAGRPRVDAGTPRHWALSERGSIHHALGELLSLEAT